MPNIVSVNFEGVESGTGSVHIPEGDYGLRVQKVQSKTGKDSGNPYLLFYLKVTSGNPAGIGKVVPHTCTLTKNSLWNLRNLLEAGGKTIPAKAIKIDIEKLVGMTLAGTAIDDEYKGKKKTVFTAFFPLADLDTSAKSDDSDDSDDLGSGDSTEESNDEEAEELFD